MSDKFSNILERKIPLSRRDFGLFASHDDATKQSEVPVPKRARIKHLRGSIPSDDAHLHGGNPRYHLYPKRDQQVIYYDEQGSATYVKGWEIVSNLSTKGLVETRNPDISNTIRRISKRVATLKDYAETEGFPFSSSSETSLKEFIAEYNLDKPSIFLLKNGNLRAVWRSEDVQIGLQFFGGNKGQLIVLDGEGTKPNQITGQHNLDKLCMLVEGAGFGSIWKQPVVWKVHLDPFLTGR